jgi:hypothetical protein
MMVLGGFVGVMALRALMSRPYWNEAGVRGRGQGQGCREED